MYSFYGSPNRPGQPATAALDDGAGRASETAAAASSRGAIPQRTDPLDLAGACRPTAGQSAAGCPGPVAGGRLHEQPNGTPLFEGPAADGPESPVGPARAAFPGGRWAGDGSQPAGEGPGGHLARSRRGQLRLTLRC